MQSQLLQMVFDSSRWEMAVEKGYAKDISPTILRWACSPQTRLELYYRIINGAYEVNVPT